MVLLCMTEAVVAAIKLQQAQSDPSSAQKPYGDSKSGKDTEVPDLDEPEVGKPISHMQIVELCRSSRERGLDGDGQITLRKLLRGSSVYVPPPPSRKEPTPEFIALMTRLRKEQEADQYERMVNPIPALDSFSQQHSSSSYFNLFPSSLQTIKSEEDDIAFADVRRQLAMIANVLLSTICCSVAVWMVAWSWSVPRRLGASMAGGLIVGVAEVVIYAGYLTRMKSAKEKERAKIETKETVNTWTIEGKRPGSKDDVILPGDSAVSKQNKSARKRKTIGMAAK